jgi:hypothetical protein
LSAATAAPRKAVNAVVKKVANELVILVDRINKAILDDRNIRTAFTSVLAIHKPRIFEKGKAANGSPIGTYSRTPASISKTRQARNTGKTYFKGGYAEYKSDIGKNPGFVILRDKDQMYADYGLQGSAGNWGLGFTNQFNADKSGWVEEHFDKQIFKLSDQETDIFKNVMLAAIKNA